MKRITILIIVLLSGMCLFGNAWAKKGKKPLKAYLSGAKIAIVEGRPLEGIALLDTLFIYYGPHAEALFRMSQIYVDLMNSESSPDAKRPYLLKMVAYVDSLHLCCENKEIKKKYRKGCDKYISQADSTKTKYWREFFALGREQLKAIKELTNDIKNETDSASLAYMEEGFQQNLDSMIANMNLALLIDSSESSPYIAVATAWEYKGDYAKAIEWMKKGLERAQERTPLLLPIAYDYINMGDYCGAIPFFKEYIEGKPEDTTNLLNLSICYNNCEMYDSAVTIYRRLLEINPENVNVMTNMGLYFNTLARKASDSITYYRSNDDEDNAKRWETARQEAFDSARVYFKTAFEIKTDDVFVAEQYGFVSALVDDCESAIPAFKRVSELKPDDANNWISLGDCYRRLAKFKDAMHAYEKVTELEPDNVEIWTSLKELYEYFDLNDKAKLADKKIKEIG